MVKERGFKIHPNVLSCLLHLRLKTELRGVRASENRSSKDEVARKKLTNKFHKDKKGKRSKDGNSTHLTKKAKKVLKETKEIQGELEEAEAVVDQEDKARQVSQI